MPDPCGGPSSATGEATGAGIHVLPRTPVQLKEEAVPRRLAETNIPAQSGSSRASHDELADVLISDCGGDPRAAVIAMLKISHALMTELQAMAVMQAHGHAPAVRRH